MLFLSCAMKHWMLENTVKPSRFGSGILGVAAKGHSDKVSIGMDCLARGKYQIVHALHIVHPALTSLSFLDCSLRLFSKCLCLFLVFSAKGSVTGYLRIYPEDGGKMTVNEFETFFWNFELC